MEEIDNDRVVYLAANGHRMVVSKQDYDRGSTWCAQHYEGFPCVDDAPPHW